MVAVDNQLIGHGILKCTHCETVIMRCKCIAGHKDIQYGICDKCKLAAQTGSVDALESSPTSSEPPKKRHSSLDGYEAAIMDFRRMMLCGFTIVEMWAVWKPELTKLMQGGDDFPHIPTHKDFLKDKDKP